MTANGLPVRFYAWHGTEEEQPIRRPQGGHNPRSAPHRQMCEPCRWAWNLWRRCEYRGGYRSIVGQP